MYPFIETIRIEDGQIYNINYHTERFNRTRATFWKDAAHIDLRQIISLPSLSGIYKCRIQYREDIEEITYTLYEMRTVSSLRLLTSDTIEYSHKSADRKALNTLFTQRGTADDVLIVKNGCLTDTTIANVALYDGTSWYTPSNPLLRGTKRTELLDKHLIVEKEILVTHLDKYSLITLFNAMIDWQKITLSTNEKHLII